MAPPVGNTFQRRRFASQTKPIQDCHPERSEGSLAEQRSFAPLRMTKPDGLFFEMDWPLWSPVPYSPGIAPRISSFMVLLQSMGYLKCIAHKGCLRFTHPLNMDRALACKCNNVLDPSRTSEQQLWSLLYRIVSCNQRTECLRPTLLKDTEIANRSLKVSTVSVH